MDHGLLLAVDPGLRKSGCAIFEADGERPGGLQTAALVQGLGLHTDAGGARMYRAGERADVLRAMARAVREWAGAEALKARQPLTRIAIELPRVRARSSQREEKRGVDPNDVVDLAAVVGAILGGMPEIDATVWLPEEWKGGVPKAIHNARAIGRLFPEELIRIPRRPRAKDFDHNIVDAVAIGLHYFGRL